MRRSPLAIFAGSPAALALACATAPVERARSRSASEWVPAPVASTAAQPDESGAGGEPLRAGRSIDPAAPWRADVVAEAGREIGRTTARLFRSDCTGFVRGVFRVAGHPLLDAPWPSQSGTEAIWKTLRGPVHAQPAPGDLAFFHDTFDRNRDGAVGDPFTHVAIVEAVEGTAVTLVHFGGHGAARLKLDVARPAVHRDGGIVVNDGLRVRREGDPPGTHYLAGELLAGFGTPIVRDLTIAERQADAERSQRAARTPRPKVPAKAKPKRLPAGTVARP